MIIVSIAKSCSKVHGGRCGCASSLQCADTWEGGSPWPPQTTPAPPAAGPGGPERQDLRLAPDGRRHLQLVLPVGLVEDLLLVGEQEGDGGGLEVGGLVQVGQHQHVHHLGRAEVWARCRARPRSPGPPRDSRTVTGNTRPSGPAQSSVES